MKKIIQKIEEFGLKVNQEKTIITSKVKEIKYLGIWLDLETHLKYNLEKSSKTFEKYQYIFKSNKISNYLKILLYKVLIMSQLFYGMEVFSLNEKQYQQIEIQINSQITKILKIQRHSPVIIYRNECGILPTRFIINLRKWKLSRKLKEIEREDPKEMIKFDLNNEEEKEIWETPTIEELKENISDYLFNEMKNSNKWKIQKYSKIIENEGMNSKIKNYLRFKNSTTLLKFRTFTNCLNRYSYVLLPKKAKRNSRTKRKSSKLSILLGNQNQRKSFTFFMGMSWI